MESANTQRTVRRVLVSVFVVAEILGAGGLYLVLRNQGVRDAEHQSRIMLASAKALRDYTETQILPPLAGENGQPFHEVTVPSFAAQTVFHNLGGSDGGYTYRESALNPTNPHDRATPFEVELVDRFEKEKGLPEITGLTTVQGEQAFYVAHPFRITDPQCLTCHSVPAAAPASMITKYGSANGFGWKLGDTIGVQLLTVPVASQFHGTLQLVALLSAGLMLVFIVAYFALSRALDSALIGPLRTLAAAADKASISDTNPIDLPKGGAKEVADLAAAIDRLRASLRRALARLGDTPPTL